MRGKAIYKDQIGAHFPFIELFFASITKLFGFKTTVLIIARIIIYLILISTIFFIYSIGKIIRNTETGILAVALSIASLTFVDKGIEIRHDVFNMFFNTAGVFFILKYCKENRPGFLVIAGLLNGLALASTQKSIMWIIGIYIGVSLFLMTKKGLIEWLKFSAVYAACLFIPLASCVSFEIYKFHDSFNALISRTIFNLTGYLNPAVKDQYPFLYSKWTIWKYLLISNGLLYVSSIVAAFYYLCMKRKELKHELVIFSWFFTGLLFYLFMRRPFLQSFLPTIPIFGLISAIYLTDLSNRFKPYISNKKHLIYPLVVLLFLAWPSFSVVRQAYYTHQSLQCTAPISSKFRNNKKQFENVSFCLHHLQKHDKVLCFTQQQVFFDPLLDFENNKCAATIHEIDEDCIITLMKKEQCKVIIFDERTRILKNEIQKILLSHYLFTGSGEVFVPGLTVQPKQKTDFEIWISGNYSLSSAEVNIDGNYLTTKRIYLEKGNHTFNNLSEKKIVIFYAFNGT
jgi:hypothetical protein